MLGQHIASGAAMTTEVIARHLEDRGGGLARVDGRPRLVEGLALPSDELESRLSYYNSATYWIDIDRLLDVFGLTRAHALRREARVNDAVRALAARMPTYITLKDVKKRWGKGQEDVFPVAQFEKLWGDMTALPELHCRFIAVPAQTRPATQGARPTRRLAPRRLRRLHRIPLRLGVGGAPSTIRRAGLAYRAKTSTLFAGRVSAADCAKPCIGSPSAHTRAAIARDVGVHPVLIHVAVEDLAPRAPAGEADAVVEAVEGGEVDRHQHVVAFAFHPAMERQHAIFVAAHALRGSPGRAVPGGSSAAPATRA